VTEEVEQPVHDACALTLVADVAGGGDDVGQLLARGRRAVVGTESARATDRLRDRPPHVGAVRDALPAEDLRVVGEVGVRRDLTCEPALADAGVARQHDEVGAAAEHGAVDDAA